MELVDGGGCGSLFDGGQFLKAGETKIGAC